MSSSGSTIPLIVFARRAGDLQRQRDIVERSTRRQQVEMLEDHADGAARLAQRLLIQRSDVEAVDGDLAVGRLFKPVDEADERRLAGAALADHADNGAFGHDEVDIVDRLHLGGILPRREDLADAIEGDDGTPLLARILRIENWHGRSGRLGQGSVH
jgi:hypothetical protein